MRQPTTDELLAALARVRALPGCAAWPADLPAVLADPVRGRLLRIEAMRWRRAPAQRAARPCASAQAAAAARPWRCHRPCSTASAPPPASAMSSRFINQIGLEPLFRKRKELSNDEH